MTKSKLLAAGLLMCFAVGVAGSQNRSRNFEIGLEYPEAELQIARVKYRTFGGAGSRGYRQPWWAIDYPMAEEHFIPALRRLTNLSVADDSVHLELTDERIFEYPFLFLQQPGQGNWRPTTEEAAQLREHLLRGGFMLIDDLHGEYDWAVLQTALRRVFPDRPIVDIPKTDNVMHVFFDLDQSVQIPGARHVRRTYGGNSVAYMEGPHRWRGVYDDRGRLMIAINHNMDMGDAWEHADDPYYPVSMTAQAYKLGVNYVIYAMTH